MIHISWQKYIQANKQYTQLTNNTHTLGNNTNKQYAQSYNNKNTHTLTNNNTYTNKQYADINK